MVELTLETTCWGVEQQFRAGNRSLCSKEISIVDVLKGWEVVAKGGEDFREVMSCLPR